MKTFHAIGLMSGSSLDGIDIASCRFVIEGTNIHEWSLEECSCFPFSEEWTNRLKQLPHESALALSLANTDFGKLLGTCTADFIKTHQLKPDLIASHGHTVFHYPAQGMTLQIGHGAYIAAATGVTTVADFRSTDIAYTGQGAPFAPIADHHLYRDYPLLLNLGGIANITAKTPTATVAFDVCGANAMLNAVASQLGYDYDEGGAIAAAGALLPELLGLLNSDPYFREPNPKSLGNDWVQRCIATQIIPFDALPADKLYTIGVHIAQQLAWAIQSTQARYGGEYRQMLVTGGGAFNTFLVQLIREHLYGIQVLVPEARHVMYKEAALMALMGVLRMAGLPNSMSSVTGAIKDACCGAVYLP